MVYSRGGGGGIEIHFNKNTSVYESTDCNKTFDELFVSHYCMQLSVI